MPTAVAAALMFLDVRGFSAGGRVAWIYFTYILFGMLYTYVNIPYGSLAQVITSDDKERSSLSVFRSVGSTFGAMPAMGRYGPTILPVTAYSGRYATQRLLPNAALVAVYAQKNTPDRPGAFPLP